MSYNEFLQSNEWIETKKFLKKVCKKECYICARVDKLQVHHLSYSAFHYEDKNDLIYLCFYHHFLFHFPKGKNNEKRDIDSQEGILEGLKWLDKEMHSIRMRNHLKLIEYKNNSPLLLYNRLTKKMPKVLPYWILKRKERLEKKKRKSNKQKGIDIARQNYLDYIDIERLSNKEYLPKL